jgi:hypothetical protein
MYSEGDILSGSDDGEKEFKMHIQEKQAWFIVVVGIVTGVLFVAGLVLCMIFGKSILPAFSAFGVFGLTGFAPGVNRRRKTASKPVAMDERDYQISSSATLISYSIFWLVFIGSLFAPMLIKGPNAPVTIKTGDIAVLGFPAIYLVFMVRSIAVLVMYRRGGGHE